MPIEKIHGPNMNDDERRSVADFYQRKRQQIFAELKRKEIGRTEWHEKMIACSTELIHDECKRLGIQNMPVLPEENYIFLSSEDYHQELPREEYEADAFYAANVRIAILNIETSRPILFSQTMHESIHAYSYHDFMAFPEESRVYRRRLGLALEKPTQGEGLNGVNEAVTERLRWKLCGEFRGRIQESLGFDSDEIKTIVRGRSYSQYIGLMDFINERIAESSDMTHDQCWDTWTRAMITGEIMGIRQVERVWGKGSLSVLSRLGYDRQTDAKVFKFFSAKSELMRSRIYRELSLE